MIEFLKGVVWAFSPIAAKIVAIFFSAAAVEVVVEFSRTPQRHMKGRLIFIMATFWDAMKWWMKLSLPSFTAMVAAICIIAALGGCATFHDPAKPNTEAEMFPVNCGTPAKGAVRENGPVGLILMTGTAPSQVCVFDQAGRLVEQWSFRGTNRFAVSQSSGQPQQFGIEKRLDPGCYRMDIYPFFKDFSIFHGEQLFILPKQSASICAINPAAVNIPMWGSTTGGFYSFRLNLTANIQPRGYYGITPVQVISTTH